MHKVGVTGGMGFIGRYVVEELHARGYVPVIFDHHIRHKSEYPDYAEVFLGDMMDMNNMSELAAHVDGIVHLGGVLGTQETVNDPYVATISNMLGGLNFLEALAKYGLPGSYIAVGNWWFNNPYSISKNMIERFCAMYVADRGVRVNIVRAVNAYGPRQLAAEPFAHGKVRKITPALVCRALSGLPMELYGGGTQVSDMVYVGDVAKALVNALERASIGETYDGAAEIGSTTSTTVRETAELVNELVQEKGYSGVQITSLPMRPGEKVGEKITADLSTLSKVKMKESDLTPLREGMSKTIDYYIESEGRDWKKPE